MIDKIKFLKKMINLYICIIEEKYKNNKKKK